MGRDEDVSEFGEAAAFGGVVPEMQACPKCRGEMVEGWIPRYIGQASFPTTTVWQPGVQDVKDVPFWRLKTPTTENPKTILPVSAFRCVRCGFLEFYARGRG